LRGLETPAPSPAGRRPRRRWWTASRKWLEKGEDVGVDHPAGAGADRRAIHRHGQAQADPPGPGPRPAARL